MPTTKHFDGVIQVNHYLFVPGNYHAQLTAKLGFEVQRIVSGASPPHPMDDPVEHYVGELEKTIEAEGVPRAIVVVGKSGKQSDAAILQAAQNVCGQYGISVLFLDNEEAFRNAQGHNVENNF